MIVPKLSISASSINTSCFNSKDGVASVIVSGGVGSGYTYSWNSVPVQTKAIATKLSAGTYSVIVKDGVSSATTSVVVGKPNPLSITTNISLNVDGGVAPYTYEWSNGQTGLANLELTAEYIQLLLRIRMVVVRNYLLELNNYHFGQMWLKNDSYG